MFFTDQPVETGLAKQQQRGLIQFIFHRYFFKTILLEQNRQASRKYPWKPACRGSAPTPLKVNHPVFQLFFKHLGCSIKDYDPFLNIPVTGILQTVISDFRGFSQLISEKLNPLFPEWRRTLGFGNDHFKQSWKCRITGELHFWCCRFHTIFMTIVTIYIFANESPSISSEWLWIQIQYKFLLELRWMLIFTKNEPVTHSIFQWRKSFGLFRLLNLIHLQLPEISIYFYIYKFCAMEWNIFSLMFP